MKTNELNLLNYANLGTKTNKKKNVVQREMKKSPTHKLFYSEKRVCTSS